MKKIALVFVLCLTIANVAIADAGQSPLAVTFGKTLAAAQGGDASAQNSLGQMYEKGRSVAPSNTQAAVWYCKAAAQGNAIAQYHLGNLSGNLKIKGIRRDATQALAWLRKAAEQGNTDAQLTLGDWYQHGDERFVPQEDQEQADMWYGKAIEGLRKAANQGDADALHTLARMYQYGNGVARDNAQAAKFYGQAIAIFLTAAEKGDAAAQVTLGEIYGYDGPVYKDDGSPYNDDEHRPIRNPGQSVMWYTKAAEQGAIDAQWRLGGMAWMRKAAEQGDDDAQYRLGMKYLNGQDGLAQDNAQAEEWLRKAARQGNVDAWQVLKKNMQVDVSDLPKPRGPQPLPCSAEQTPPSTASAADNSQAVCAASKYHQEKFNQQIALTEFQDFQKRLRHGFDNFYQVDDDDVMAQLHEAFADSVAVGPKGDALLESFVKSGGGRIVPPMQTMLDLLLNKACPVGFGGKFDDDGHQVELWYFDLTPGSAAENQDVLKAFKEPELPAYGSLVRDAFPALVFERDPQGRLKWYGVSREMAAILSYWLNIQIM